MTIDKKAEEEFVMVSTDNRNKQVEEQFNMHIGKPYRFLVETTVYDGIMTRYLIHIDEEGGFLPVEVELRPGFCYRVNDPTEKIPFDEERLGPSELARVRGRNFGRIMDEEGFSRIIKELG